VVVDDTAECILLEFALLWFQSIFFELPRHEVPLGDLEFLALGVTGDGDHFDPVAQRFRYAFEVIGGPDENHLRKIKRHVQVTIDEGVVLTWIEHLEQGAGGVAAKIRTDLVDLIEHEHRVARTDATQFLNYAAGHRPDVGAAMAADFCLAAHPAETDPHEFATQRVSDRLAETGFADAGRPEKTEDSTVSLRIEFAHGEIFDQPFLNLFKIVVIAIENLLCLIE